MKIPIKERLYLHVGEFVRHCYETLVSTWQRRSENLCSARATHKIFKNRFTDFISFDFFQFRHTLVNIRRLKIKL